MLRFNSEVLSRDVLRSKWFLLSCDLWHWRNTVQFNIRILSWSFPKVEILTVCHAEESRVIAWRLTRVDTLVTYAARFRRHGSRTKLARHLNNIKISRRTYVCAAIVIKRKLNDEDLDARNRLLDSNVTSYKRNRISSKTATHHGATVTRLLLACLLACLPVCRDAKSSTSLCRVSGNDGNFGIPQAGPRNFRRRRAYPRPPGDTRNYNVYPRSYYGEARLTPLKLSARISVIN